MLFINHSLLDNFTDLFIFRFQAFYHDFQLFSLVYTFADVIYCAIIFANVIRLNLIPYIFSYARKD